MAEESFRKAIDEYPLGDKDLWKWMGELMKKQGRITEALSCYEKAERATSPHYRTEYAQVLLKTGSLHLQLGHYESAKDRFTWALPFIDGQDKLQVEEMISQLDRKIMSVPMMPQVLQDIPPAESTFGAAG